MGIFLFEVPSFQIILVCVKMTKTSQFGYFVSSRPAWAAWTYLIMSTKETYKQNRDFLWHGCLGLLWHTKPPGMDFRVFAPWDSCCAPGALLSLGTRALSTAQSQRAYLVTKEEQTKDRCMALSVSPGRGACCWV